jgi:glycosyltransferase involved in cell wall biosynthesis
MKIVFCSNFLNHHQLPLAQAFLSQGNEFIIVADQPVPQDRLSLGYADMNKQYDFVIPTYENEEQYQKAVQAVQDADVVIVGSILHDYLSYCHDHQVLFRYSERLFKKGEWKFHFIPVARYYLRKRFQKYPQCYLLAAGYYAAHDFLMIPSFEGKTLKWGYFPKTIHYEKLPEKKTDPLEVLWCGRFLDWKHPEQAVLAAKEMNDKGYSFHLSMLGEGEMLEPIRQMIRKNRLETVVSAPGSMSYEVVRRHMEKASVFLFTSDRQEGWGAVLNEAMNSGCACIVNDEIGAAGFLVKPEENGLLYHRHKQEELDICLERLLEDKSLIHNLGRNAYQTIIEEWNSDTAAARLTAFSKSQLNHDSIPEIQEGPMSPAEDVSQPWNERLF